MSMISEQVNELRKAAKWFEGACFPEAVKLLDEAADTIESLSAKLATANMECSSAYYGNGWIPCSERLPVTAEYMEFEPTPYMKRLEIAYMTDTVEYLIGFYDGCKWMDKHHNIIKNVIAWKPFLKLPEEYHG
ncbi:hypothetical protein D7X98_04140 [bacterium 1XD8-76]|nr:hypothetical protein D7X98_04140 [bacterium 1XD8-76]